MKPSWTAGGGGGARFGKGGENRSKMRLDSARRRRMRKNPARFLPRRGT